MKFDSKIIGLVTVSFLCGYLCCALLVSPSLTRQSTAQVIVSGPVLATSPFQPPLGSVTLKAPHPFDPGMIQMERDPLADEPLPGGRPARSLDLIDMRYQPVH